MILGITGGTGCGKTTLLEQIRSHGGLVLDCDAIYHELLRCDTAMLDAIRSRFPAAFENGALNRKKLGTLVFADADALQELNRITHAAVTREVRRRLAEKPALAAIDAIALFESGLNELCDLTVAITAPEDVRIQRLMLRDGISAEYAASRIGAQHDEGWFRSRCDYILENNSDFSDFQTKCIAFLQERGIIPFCRAEV